MQDLLLQPLAELIDYLGMAVLIVLSQYPILNITYFCVTRNLRIK